MFHGFLNLNKPAGITAHDCVNRVRRSLKQKRVGHSGTLDPAATGVLPIAVGQATRLLQFLLTGKAYKAKVKFGLVTNTDDLDGETIRSRPCPHLSLAEVEKLLPIFHGNIQQRPPAFSAIQVGGMRLYELARAGKPVEVPLRTVEVKQINVLEWQDGDFPELDLEIVCGGGTYIRAIARDLGEMLGFGATLAALERTSSNNFNLADSVTLEAVAAGSFEIIPPAIALSHLGNVSLEPDLTRRWQQGQAISLAEINTAMPLSESSHVCAYNSDQTFLGIGQIQTEHLRPIVVFN